MLRPSNDTVLSTPLLVIVRVQVYGGRGWFVAPLQVHELIPFTEQALDMIKPSALLGRTPGHIRLQFK